MKILLLTNKRHKVALEAIKFLKKKKINFKCIDTKIQNRIKISGKFDYLFSFLNPLFINRDVRKKIKKNSINIHPGPPEYPGYGCYNFALLDGLVLAKETPITKGPLAYKLGSPVPSTSSPA